MAYNPTHATIKADYKGLSRTPTHDKMVQDASQMAPAPPLNVGRKTVLKLVVLTYVGLPY
jgi:hypothetical protein